VFLLLPFASLSSVSTETDAVGTTSEDPQSYGVDVSFPMHHAAIKDDDYPIGPGKQQFYSDFMSGCRVRYGELIGEACDNNEAERIDMNLNQPKTMKNFTEAGYAKIAAPKAIRKMIFKHFEQYSGKQRQERWPKGNTYVNHWKQSSYMLDMPEKMRQRISDLSKEIIEAWTGQKLVETSLYGIRVYRRGAVLAPHVDRLPLVSSCIINVAQDVDEPWPIEVIGHDGKAHNITMEPGEMVLYESHSVIHGRPFPLNGGFYANIFVHFEPFGYSQQHAAPGVWGDDIDGETEELYEAAMATGKQEYVDSLEHVDEVPSYLDPGEVNQWKQRFVYEEDTQKLKHTPKITSSQPEGMTAHTAAALGRLDLLKKMKARDPSLLTKRDENGWQPMHEAARSGHLNVLEYLVENGGDVSARTNNGKGGTPLWWATQMLSPNHKVVKFLESKGAKKVGPQEVDA